ncbi:hypothetical protein ACW9UM_14695 [Marinovum sp. KMM 9989]
MSGNAMRAPRFSPKSMDQLGRPLCSVTPELEACRALFDEGRTLVRQDHWGKLCAKISAADANRSATAAGTPTAELLAAGARSDLSRALYSASDVGALSLSHPMLAGLEEMSATVQDHPDSAACATVVALCHMDAGWAWYRQGWQRGRPEQHLGAFRDAFERARAMLAPFASEAETSPLLASARCALLAGTQTADHTVVDDYETLIGLAPRMPGHMRAYGLHMLPCWFGSHDALDLAARRIAARTGDDWGAGGYAWVYLDALQQDPGAFARLDTGFFIEAVEDILTRSQSQHMTNLFAASLSQLLDTGRSGPTGVAGKAGAAGKTGPDRAQRKALDQLRTRLIRTEMRETHAWVWSITDTGYATPGYAPNGDRECTETGGQRAWQVISAVLSRDPQRLHGQPGAAR